MDQDLFADPGVALLEERLRAEGWAEHMTLARALLSWTSTSQAVKEYSLSVDEYTNDLSARDYLQLVIDGLPRNLGEHLASMIDAIDAQFRAYTTDDVKGLLSGFYEIKFYAAWWWRRIPITGPLAGYLHGSIDSVPQRTQSDAVPSELVEWFSVNVDEGDGPELHLEGLEARQLVSCFAALQAHKPNWSKRTFWIDAAEIDATVQDRPDVAELVLDQQVSVACIGANDLDIDGVRLPLVEMFLYPSAIQFFWWPSSEWTAERIKAFFGLLVELLDLAPAAQLHPDPRYDTHARVALGRAIAGFIGRPERVSPPQ